MEKSYLDELSEWLDRHPKKKEGLSNSGKIAFLAVKDDVKTALDAGYPMSLVWENMSESGKLKCGYEVFRRHVRRHIRQPADEGKAADSSPPKETPAAEKTPEVKTAKGDDSADSETADPEPWRLQLKIANEKIAAMKPNVPTRKDPPPPEKKVELGEDGLPVDPYAERKRLAKESYERNKPKKFLWNPVQLTDGEIKRGKRDKPEEKNRKGTRTS